MSTSEQRAAIISTFDQVFGAGAAAALGRMSHVDRVYELHCLITLIDRLRTIGPRLVFTLSTGSRLTLRASGGPIDRTTDSCVEVWDESHSPVAEIWSNVEFQSLSHVHGAGGHNFSGAARARAHELDLVLLKPGVSGRPSPNDILIGVEAKHRPYGKGLLKELLGVRREMAFVDRRRQNRWAWWAHKGLPANPPSGMVAWCAYSSISDFNQPADFYGMLMEHLPLSTV